MKLAIMQPYFFPYLGHFDLIARVDRWVVFDTAQYIRRGWMHRNRVLHPYQGWWYVNVPVERHDRDSPISEIQVAETVDWRTRLLDRLEHYRGVAPFFREATDVVEHCLGLNIRQLSRLNVAMLDIVCGKLGINFEPVFLSELDIDPGAEGDPGMRILQIASALGANTYVNPPGGERLFDRHAFEHYGIKLEIQDYEPLTYSTGPWDFEPRLSVIDSLMWNSLETLYSHLQRRDQPA